MADWKPHVFRVGTTPGSQGELDAPPGDPDSVRQRVEPWLSSVLQSDHLSLLLGSGFSSSISHISGAKPVTMAPIKLDGDLGDKIIAHATVSAKAMGRGAANVEDQLRSALAVLAGLQVLESADAAKLETALETYLTGFLKALLKMEQGIYDAIAEREKKGEVSEVRAYLLSFLMTFSSRATSRERLNLFTTNYDRLIEFGADEAGLRTVDRFVGALSPVFRSSRLDVDLHYNPPGIRGEPRLLEGVIRLCKLHGSIDWAFEKGVLRKLGIPFGASETHSELPKKPVETVMIYPNPAKDVETGQYPYADLFRDFSAALCRPNSSLITYGYGFGDDHVNRVIADMLTLPSTHLVVISFDAAGGRIQRFCERHARDAQVSLLLGNHFGDIKTLVDHYLPKPAIDTITGRMADLLKSRGADPGKLGMPGSGAAPGAGSGF